MHLFSWQNGGFLERCGKGSCSSLWDVRSWLVKMQHLFFAICSTDNFLCLWFKKSQLFSFSSFFFLFFLFFGNKKPELSFYVI